MNRGKYPAQAMYPGHVEFLCAFMGGGAASNGTLPDNGVLNDSDGDFPKIANFGTSLTYNSSTGLYLLVYSETIKHPLFATGIVIDSGSAPTTALVCVVSKIIPSSKTLNLRIYTPAGTLTDLGTSDMLIVKVTGADTASLPGIS